MPLALMCAAFVAFEAHAFDPFTVVAAGSAAVSLVETVSQNTKGSSDLRELFSAMGELNDEISTQDGGSDPYLIARKIEAIETTAYEAGYTKDEVEGILNGARGSNHNVSQAIRLLSRSIRMGKRVVSLVGILGGNPGAAGMFQAGTMQNQAQEKKILTDIYGHMISRELDEKLDEVKTQKAIQEQYKKLRAFVYSVAPHGNLALFPIDSAVIKKAIDVYKSYYWILFVLIGAIFMGRVVYYQFSFAPAEKYQDLIRDVFTCYFVILALPYVYTYMIDCSEALSVKLGQILNVTGQQYPPDMLPIDKTKWFWWFRSEVFALLLYAFTHIVFNFAISIIIAVGPIVILVGTMMNFTISVSAYFALLVLVCLWPTFWNVLGYFKNILWVDSGFGSTVASFFVFLFQILSPLVIGALLKRTVAGQVAGQAASHATSGATTIATGGYRLLRGKNDSPKEAPGIGQNGGSGGTAPGAAAYPGVTTMTPLITTKRVRDIERDNSRQGVVVGKARF